MIGVAVHFDLDSRIATALSNDFRTNAQRVMAQPE